MHFILLCMLVGAFVLYAPVRQVVGAGCMMFLVGFAVIALSVLVLVAFLAHSTKRG